MPRKKKTDAQSEAAKEATLARIEQMKANDREREQRECLIAETNKYLGRIEAMKAVNQFSNVSMLVWLKQVKESKIYKNISELGTWEAFCNRLGFSRQYVDQHLLNLRDLGEEFLRTVNNFKVGYSELQKLRWAANEGEMVIEGGIVKIGDREIPIDDSHREDLEAAIEFILEEKANKEAEVKKLAKKVENIESEEVKNLRIERDALIKENKRLKAFDPEGKDPVEFNLGQIQVIKELAMEFNHMCRQLIMDDRLKEDLHTQALVMGSMTEARSAIMGLQQRWDEQFNDYEDIP